MADSKKPTMLEADWDALLTALDQPLSSEREALLNEAQALEKWPVAQLISLFERNTDESFIVRHQVMQHIARHADQFSKNATVLGVTGTPGAGKSSLIGAICKHLLQSQPEMSIAVLAIDPSSQISGGALLGDRTRTQFPVKDKRLFFRSQASQQDLGGMGKSTFHVTRLLRKLFDLVIIETVGIGQSEIEVQRISDHTLLVMQPMAGDQVQFMKAGIMEVPDTFVVNKCDEDNLARKSYELLKSSLKLARIHVDHKTDDAREIFMTSATRNKGIDTLAQHLLSLKKEHDPADTHVQETYFLYKWIRQAYGEFGLGVQQHFETDTHDTSKTFEQKELGFKRLIAQFVKQVH